MSLESFAFLAGRASASGARSRGARARWLCTALGCVLSACAAGAGVGDDDDDDSDDGAGPPAYGNGFVPGAQGGSGFGAPPVGSAMGGSANGLGNTQGGSSGFTPAPGEGNNASGMGGGAPSNGGGPSTNPGQQPPTNPPSTEPPGNQTPNEPPPGNQTPNEPPPGEPPGNQTPNEPPPNEPPAGPDIDCPAGATFCSGFESAAFPAGTQFHAVGPGSNGAFSFDTSDPFAGSTSLLIPATGSGGFFYRALAVPVPGQDFWVRLYMRLSSPLGDNSHDSVFGGSSGGLAADVNGEALVELSEQFNEILLNTDDALFNPPTTTTIPANTWLCMEGHYDGNSGDVQIFMDGTEVISASGYRQVTYQTFRIGYMRYNDDRSVAYDDVVVAPNRVGCN